MTFPEIAEIQQVNKETARSRVYYALKSLRQSLKGFEATMNDFDRLLDYIYGEMPSEEALEFRPRLRPIPSFKRNWKSLKALGRQQQKA